MSAAIIARIAVLAATGVLVLLLLAAPASSHICVFAPHQRGALDVSQAGDHDCYRKTQPCGDNTPGPIAASLQPRQLYTVRWQQNFNHYEPGWPGWMDISFACNDSGSISSADQFTQLRVVPDFYAHFQATQTNYSMEVELPDTTCSHGLLRARYSPNKPTEDQFLQCSDIAINAQPNDAVYLYGLKTTEVDQSVFVQVDVSSGVVLAVAPQDVVVRVVDSQQTVQSNAPFAVDDVVGVSPHGFFYPVASGSPAVGAVPDTLLGLTAEGAVTTKSQFNPAFPINSLDYDSSTNSFVSTGINRTQDGEFSLNLLRVTDSGDASVFGSFTPNQNIVNFLWSVVDVPNNRYIQLVGNENTAWDLQALLFIYDLTTGEITNKTLLDTSKYSFNSIHWDAEKSRLLAVSPGVPVNGIGNSYYDANWYLVEVDLATGSVAKIAQLLGVYDHVNAYYGGGTFNWDSSSRQLYHVFHKSATDGSQLTAAIGTIDVDTGALSLTPFSAALAQVHNLALL